MNPIHVKLWVLVSCFQRAPLTTDFKPVSLSIVKPLDAGGSIVIGSAINLSQTKQAELFVTRRVTPSAISSENKSRAFAGKPRDAACFLSPTMNVRQSDRQRDRRLAVPIRRYAWHRAL